MKELLFAPEFNFYKIMLIFVAGGVLGDLAETVFCYLKYKKWMCRSSFVYCQLSAVWGLGFVAASVLAYKMTGYHITVVFAAGAILGSAVEYACSFVLEKVFGVTFWDYSKFKYNIEGRVNLLYSLYWGIAGVLWINHIFPAVSELLDQIPVSVLVPLGEGLFILLSVDSFMSIVALKRYGERKKGIEADDRIRVLIDRHFTDERLERIYPHMKMSAERAVDKCECVDY